MGYSEKDKLKTLAIVSIFETSRPFGDYAACVVLNDGAGISYGSSQFTHQSGSLAAVVERYLENRGRIGVDILRESLPSLRRTTAYSIRKLSGDDRLKNALRSAAVSREMKEAQRETAIERYLRPSIEICEKRGFSLPLSLAVVYDSVVHGSWERIGRIGSPGDSSEKTWVTAYVRRRHLWLTNTARLRATNYRTKFFLDQIAIGNWELRLPMTVHGVRLTENDLPSSGKEMEAQARSNMTDESGSVFESAESGIAQAAAGFDRVDTALTAVATRTDRAKSLWTTVLGTIWQVAWGIFGFAAGLPREVWLVVAAIAGILMLAYLYRQIALGKIRETGLGDGRRETEDRRGETGDGRREGKSE